MGMYPLCIDVVIIIIIKEYILMMMVVKLFTCFINEYMVLYGFLIPLNLNIMYTLI